MKFLRASECGYIGEISQCILRYPPLKHLVGNPYVTGGNPTTRLQGVRDHAVALAREHALDELGKVKDLAKEDLFKAQRQRQKNTKLIFRLSPGRGGSIGALEDSRGNLIIDKDSMAEELRRHWKETFTSRQIDRDLLRDWLQEDQDKLPADAGITCSPTEFNVRRRHVRHALANTNNSSPGPDGIPFLVWRRLRELGVTYLYEAIKEMVSEGGVEKMRRDYPDFNASLLIFVPKKASGIREDGTAYYNANGFMPHQHH